MAKLGIYNAERKKWIQYDEDTEVLIKHVGKEELNEISTKARKQAKLSGSTDIGAIINQRLGKIAVLGWRKIEDPTHPGFVVNDAPLPFTPENVGMLMAKSLDFSNFVNENAINANEFLTGVEETKNA
jgi:hypothetical protein